jgi:leucyl/phenylalanyl-tRNA--protein transferase
MLALCQQMVSNDFEILDCQVESPHLVSLGASLMPRNKFAAVLRRACKSNSQFLEWPAERRQVLDFLW